MPPNIAYRLTPLGATLVDATTPLVMWAIENLSSIDAARGRYDDDHVKEVHELNR
jgi:DNA-binding HxlR family transcriptional regulator